MASAKQLAALKKGREARAKKLRAKTTPKTKARKTVAKKPSVKRAIAQKFVVKITTKNGRVGYLAKNGTLDTDLNIAALLTEKVANENATDIFNRIKRQINSVEVVALKK